MEIHVSLIYRLRVFLENERLFVLGVWAGVREVGRSIVFPEVCYDASLLLELVLVVSAKLGRSLFHDGFDISESQVLLLQVFHVDFALLAKYLPVDTDAQVGWVCWIVTTVELRLVPSFLADVVLVPLFHFIPNVELEHGFVVAEPTVFDSSDVEAGYSEKARDDCAEANEYSELLRLLDRVETIVIKQG